MSDTPPSHNGSCLCGAVKFHVTGPLSDQMPATAANAVKARAKRT